MFSERAHHYRLCDHVTLPVFCHVKYYVRLGILEHGLICFTTFLGELTMIALTIYGCFTQNILFVSNFCRL